jgi:nucleoside-diphosphate-sugar epimerase
VVSDLSDFAAWLDILNDIDCVVHLSWRTSLRAAEADPTEDELLNVRPVRALIEAVKILGRPIDVVFASTVTVIGDKHELPATDDTPNCPISVYDKHKLVCEQLLADATQEGLMRACSLRLSNVYGRGQESVNSERGILNIMIRRAAMGHPVTVYGNGEYVRDFVHLHDVIDAFGAAIASREARDGHAYMIGTGEGLTIADVFSAVASEASKFSGRAVSVEFVDEPADLHPIERRNFAGRSALFHARTGWTARMNVMEAIRDDIRHALAEKTPDTAIGVKAQ